MLERQAELRWGLPLALAAALCGTGARAGLLSDKDMQVAARAAATVALVGGGLTGGSATLTAKAAYAAGLVDGSGYAGNILAQGIDPAAVATVHL
jgi:hypothetical protein